MCALHKTGRQVEIHFTGGAPSGPFLSGEGPYVTMNIR